MGSELKRVEVVAQEALEVPLDGGGEGLFEADEEGLVKAQLGHFVGELEEEQVGDPLDVVAVTGARVLEDVGVVPDFLDDGGGVAHELESLKKVASVGNKSRQETPGGSPLFHFLNKRGKN